MAIEYCPVGDVIYVEPDDPRKMTRLEMPDSNDPMAHFRGMGTVRAMGEGKMFFDESSGKFVLAPQVCKVGDRVLVWIGQQNLLKPHDRVVCMLRSEQIIAVVKGEPELN